MSIRSLTNSSAVVVAITMALAGCGKQVQSQPTQGMSASAADATAPFASATSGVDQSMAIANDVIVSDGTSQSVSTDTGAAAVAGTPAASFVFSSQSSVTVDLDATNVLGQDRFPNASGRFTVAWNGAVTPSQPTGSGGVAGHTVTVTYLTACVFTDPISGATATIAANAVLVYTLQLDWTRVDAQNWFVHALATQDASNLSVSVIKGPSTIAVAFGGHREADTTVTMSNGVPSLTRNVVATWTGTVTRNGVAHAVIWDRKALNAFFFTVDGTVYGPYSLSQVVTYLRTRVL